MPRRESKWAQAAIRAMWDEKAKAKAQGDLMRVSRPRPPKKPIAPDPKASLGLTATH